MVNPKGNSQVPSERWLELASILAAGLMRLYARKSSQISAASEESSLDFTPAESGHPTQLGSEKIE